MVRGRFSGLVVTVVDVDDVIVSVPCNPDGGEGVVEPEVDPAYTRKVTGNREVVTLDLFFVDRVHKARTDHRHALSTSLPLVRRNRVVELLFAVFVEVGCIVPCCREHLDAGATINKVLDRILDALQRRERQVHDSLLRDKAKQRL